MKNQVDKKKRQVMRYTDAELSLIKNTFADAEDLTRAIRKAFLQMPLKPLEAEILSNIFFSKEMRNLLKKTLLPELDPDAPIHQLVDLWLTVDIDGKNADDLRPIFAGRQILIDLLTQQFEELDAIVEKRPFSREITLKELVVLDDKESEDFMACLIARNTLIKHVEMQLNQLILLAGRKEETVEETMERLRKDSAK